MQKESGETLFLPTLVYYQKLEQKQFRSACKKIRDKSLVIKSEGFFGLKEGEMQENGGREWYKERGKYNIESRIEFPDPMFMT